MEGKIQNNWGNERKGRKDRKKGIKEREGKESKERIGERGENWNENEKSKRRERENRDRCKERGERRTNGIRFQSVFHNSTKSFNCKCTLSRLSFLPKFLTYSLIPRLTVRKDLNFVCL